MQRRNDHKYAPRARKAAKISAILTDYWGEDWSQSRCLDVGCATGAISNQLAPRFKFLHGVDLDYHLIEQATVQPSSNAAFAQADGSKLPFTDHTFDIVLCAQVYEHAPDQQRLAAEIWRILRPGGICFFSGPNRLAIVEEHYWLPFLSWFPQPLADLYMKLMGTGAFYDVHPLTYWQLQQLWRAFTIKDYTRQMLYAPDKFAVQDKVNKLGWIKYLPPFAVNALSFLLPNYNWILVKPS